MTDSKTLAASLLTCALLMANSLVGNTAQAEMPLFSVGVGGLGFADERIQDLYGTRPVGSLSLQLMHRRWVAVGLKAAYTQGETQPGGPDFITYSKTKMSFVPIGLFVHAVHSITPSLQAYAGPQVAYTWFSESWTARIGSIGVTDQKDSPGSYFAFGLDSGVRLRLARASGLDLSIESMWGSTDREAFPGNLSQTTSMTAGWYGLRLGWFWAGSGWEDLTRRGGTSE